MAYYKTVLLVVVLNIQGFEVVLGGSCTELDNCESCVSQSGWFPCLWCPKDNTCHRMGSLFNHCSKTENVHTKSECGRVFVKYDASLAYKMVFLSALAYSDDVSKYIPKASVVDSFRLIKQVTEPCPGEAYCSGFVAVSDKEKAIAVAFRGSEHFKQVIEQVLEILGKPKVTFQAGGKVQAYFNNAYELIWTGLMSDFYEQTRNYPSYNVWVTGHSLGGALASLASTVIAKERETSSEKGIAGLYLYTFGQPRVGDYNYALIHDKLVPTSYRVTHHSDPVVHLPTCSKILTYCTTTGPYHHGNEIFYNNQVMTSSSSYKLCDGLPYNEDKKCSNDPKYWLKCFLGKLDECITDHKKYFDFDVGTWWKG